MTNTDKLNHIWETLYDHGNGKYRGDVSKEQRELAMQYVEELKAEQAEQEPVAKWIDPNDKSQQQYLPHIGEKVLFCCDGEIYYGHHTGGAFQKGHGVTKSLFPTWDCM